jgi:drug/metabolite transporter (DMT)-like permease
MICLLDVIAVFVGRFLAVSCPGLELLKHKMKNSPHRWRGVIFAVAAALLFGASTPFAKELLLRIDPWLLAGLLYLGSGLGLFLVRVLRKFSGSVRTTPLSRTDVPWLGAAIVCGGVLGPVLLLLGLRLTPASSTSLLLNLEGVLTALLAWFVFRENFDTRIAIGMALITAGAVTLSWSGRPEFGASWGALAIAGACLAWAADNNFTRMVSGADPISIAMLKGLSAGGANTLLALLSGASMPATDGLISAGILGLLGYGVSLALFVLALRYLGTARTGAYFSIAPFVGAAVSIAWLREPLTSGFLVSALLMASGVWLYLTERHEHSHHHEPMQHQHSHWHDEHHPHSHAPRDAQTEPHTHQHRHDLVIHSHPHYPDLHHRHDS